MNFLKKIKALFSKPQQKTKIVETIDLLSQYKELREKIQENLTDLQPKPTPTPQNTCAIIIGTQAGKSYLIPNATSPSEMPKKTISFLQQHGFETYTLKPYAPDPIIPQKINIFSLN